MYSTKLSSVLVLLKPIIIELVETVLFDNLSEIVGAKVSTTKADEETISKIIAAYKELKGPGHRYKIYEFKDEAGIILLNLYDIQSIFVTGGTENAN